MPKGPDTGTGRAGAGEGGGGALLASGDGGAEGGNASDGGGADGGSTPADGTGGADGGSAPEEGTGGSATVSGEDGATFVLPCDAAVEGEPSRVSLGPSAVRLPREPAPPGAATLATSSPQAVNEPSTTASTNHALTPARRRATSGPPEAHSTCGSTAGVIKSKTRNRARRGRAVLSHVQTKVVED